MRTFLRTRASVSSPSCPGCHAGCWQTSTVLRPPSYGQATSRPRSASCSGMPASPTNTEHTGLSASLSRTGVHIPPWRQVRAAGQDLLEPQHIFGIEVVRFHHDPPDHLSRLGWSRGRGRRGERGAERMHVTADGVLLIRARTRGTSAVCPDCASASVAVHRRYERQLTPPGSGLRHHGRGARVPATAWRARGAIEWAESTSSTSACLSLDTVLGVAALGSEERETADCHKPVED